MPPRYAYWTILAGGLPTAFRAADREELLPTFHRLREKHPDAELKYFAQGKLWSSPAEARNARENTEREFRGRDWRPGGEHRDPRQKFRDEKRAQNQERRQQRFERKQRPASGDGRGDSSAPRDDRRPREMRHQQPPREKPHGDRFRSAGHGPRPKPAHVSGDRRDRPWHDRDRRDKPWRDTVPREKPHGDPLRRKAKPDWRTRSTGSQRPDHRGQRPGMTRAGSDREQRRERNERQDKPRSSRPPQHGWNDRAPRKRDWIRNQEPAPHEPPHGPSPTREPPPSESPAPTPPPRPSEPEVPPPGPPERGRRTPRPFKGRSRT